MLNAASFVSESIFFFRSGDPPFLAALERIVSVGASDFAQQLVQLARGIVKHDEKAKSRAFGRIAGHLHGVMTVSDLFGRGSVLKKLDSFQGSLGGAQQRTEERAVALALSGPYEAAAQDLMRRETRLARNAAHVSDIYSKRHAFALAAKTSREVAEAVKFAVAESVRRGLPADDAAQIIAQIGGFTFQYAKTVFLTNASTAFTAGMFQMAMDEDVRRVFPAFEFQSAKLPTSRDNHVAMHGCIAGTTDQFWKKHSPPWGFNCHCRLRLMDRESVRQRGLFDKSGNVKRYLPSTFSKAYPDTGFGIDRPDLRVYAGALV
jgi:hypothetical protein